MRSFPDTFFAAVRILAAAAAWVLGSVWGSAQPAAQGWPGRVTSPGAESTAAEAWESSSQPLWRPTPVWQQPPEVVIGSWESVRLWEQDLSGPVPGQASPAVAVPAESSFGSEEFTSAVPRFFLPSLQSGRYGNAALRPEAPGPVFPRPTPLPESGNRAEPPESSPVVAPQEQAPAEGLPSSAQEQAASGQQSDAPGPEGTAAGNHSATSNAQAPSAQAAADSQQSPKSTSPEETKSADNSNPEDKAAAKTKPEQTQSPEKQKPEKQSPGKQATAEEVPAEAAKVDAEAESSGWFAWPPVLEQWDTRFKAGVDGTAGNNQRFTTRLGLDVDRKTETFVWASQFDYVVTTSAGVQIENEAIWDGRFERLDKDHPAAWFVHSNVEYDRFTAFDVRLTLDGGLSYYFVRDPDLSFKARTAGGTSREFGVPGAEYIPEFSYGLEFQWKPSKRHELKAKTDVYSDVRDFSNFRATTRATWRMRVDSADRVSIQFELLNRYDSTPNGKEKYDLTYSMQLVWDL